MGYHCSSRGDRSVARRWFIARSLEGRELVFRNQGALWGDAMTWWDHETGSIWSQPLGEAIAGPLKGSKLELLPASFTTWSTWRTSHPDTLALEGYGGIDFDLIAVAIAVEFGDDAVAYKIRDLREVHVINDTVAGTEIAVVLDPRDDNQWSVFSRRLDDRVVELVAENLQIVDLETGSVWDPFPRHCCLWTPGR